MLRESKKRIIIKTIKQILAVMLLAMLCTSCYTETVIVSDPVIPVDDGPSLNQVLSQYEIWYVDIDASSGNLVVPFLQKAFTVSFINGTLFANNNLAGLGQNGGGFGIDVGAYDTFGFELAAFHDLDGDYSFDVTVLSSNEIELFHPSSGASYLLVGYQRNNFDYDLVFYNNIHYFLQEYVAWEKIYTSDEGQINPFDNENFLQFLPAGNSGNFRSSENGNGTPINNLFWDYDGIYDVEDVPGDFYLKTLTLDYNFPDNEFFELTVIDNETIALFQVTTGTTYEFRGKRYIQIRAMADGKFQNAPKLRKKKATIKEEIIALKAKKAKALKK